VLTDVMMVMLTRTRRVQSAGLPLLLGLAALGAILTLLAGWPARAAAEILYVAPGGDCGEAVPCFASVQAAVDAAPDYATVKVAQGVYTGDGSQVVLVSRPITLTGGYSISDWNLSNPTHHPTVVDAENATNRRGVVIHGADGAPIRLSGLTVRSGRALYSKGGGVYVHSGVVEMRQVVLEDCVADTGGGLYQAGGSLTLAESWIKGNLAHWDGGGLALGNGTLLLQGNRVQGNTATRHGGGLSVAAGVVELSGNIIAGNQANSGSGLAVGGGQVTGVNDVIARNVSPWDGVYVAGSGSVHARHWTLVSNSGYALTTYGGQALLTNTLVVSHALVGLWGLDITADHTLFYGNGEQCGGGAICTGSVEGDPGFFSPVGWNYHIRPGSAAVDAGVDAGVSWDMDGEPRPAGQGVDIGADELWPYQLTFLPLVWRLPAVNMPDPLPPPVPMTGTTPLNWPAIRAGLQAQGQDLAFVKIGFHLGVGGNAVGFGAYLDTLALDGVPVMVKSVDNFGVCADALAANPDNVVVFRKTGALELPNYDLPPEQSAVQHWSNIKAALPTEFDKRTWLEVMNEPDKDRSDWLGTFAYHIGQQMLSEGYRFAAFGWSSGEPEPEHWTTPGMLQFLHLAAANPDRIAVAVHEYSYTVNDIAEGYPYLVGRFQDLFRICDEHGIPRPTVLITEWGWEYNHVPAVVDDAMDDIAWASWLYAAYPQVKGAAIWYLGGGFGGIADEAQRLIAPVLDYAQTSYFVIEPGQGRVAPELFQPGAARSPEPVDLPGKTWLPQKPGWLTGRQPYRQQELPAD